MGRFLRHSVYRLLFVCFLCVCTVTDFSAADKASGVKFCSAVNRRPRHGISHFGELCSPRSPKSDESVSAPQCGRKIGMCGYTPVPEYGRTCFCFVFWPRGLFTISRISTRYRYGFTLSAVTLVITGCLFVCPRYQLLLTGRVREPADTTWPPLQR